ncbi:SusC/RagA family TonB-linked outer membrane protein [Thalassobellus citreus]|uniref:SusC/RagA family TonB-linked outer membrane protein n=1 Tax=Thalassobellus citreus TaxID=3367752 RepID=UPI00378A0A6E
MTNFLLLKKESFKQLGYVFLMLVFCAGANAQTTVTGSVSDQNGPLPGVSVIVEGTTNGVATDFDGNYTLNDVPSNGTLVFSYVGYTSQKVSVNGKTSINIVLTEDLQSLAEVVVVGYGTQSRAEVTGAISSVSSESITATPVVNAEQALQGRAAGVTVINNGSPGASPIVRIRGLGTTNGNSPLIVIDGVVSGNGLSGINPNDIESMNVLKDASTTAIYGSRGANGVVMVTTKKGLKNGKVNVTFDTYAGVQYISNRYDVLNTAQYLQYANDLGVTIGRTDVSGETNWQDELFTSGLMTNYDLGISGGGENSNYKISAGYADQDGAVVETGFKRYSFRANSNFSLGKVKFGETLAMSFNNQAPEIASGGRSLIEHAIKMAPYLSVYNSTNLGGYQGPSSSVDGQDAENPVRIMELGNRQNNYLAITGSLFGEYDIIEGLKFKSQLGFDYRNYKNSAFSPSHNDDDLNTGTGVQTYAQIDKNTGVNQNIIFTNSLNYERTLNDVHNFDLLLLTERQASKFTSINAQSRNFLTDGIEELSNTNATLSSRTDKYTLVSYLGRLNYNYDQKYIFAASLRRDGSSRFGANNRWGWFPSLALGWNIAKEDFLSDSNFSNLKLRGSWGVAGNDNIGNYAYTTSLTPNFFYPFGGNNATGVTAEGVANPNVKWEETTMINIGLDAGLFNDKITMALEYYNNESNDLLMRLNLADSFGFTNNFVYDNVGSVKTQGLELSLGYNDFDGDFTWSANFNLGTSKNEALSLGGLDDITGGNFENENLTRVAPGESLFHFFGLQTDGIYQNQAEVDAVFFNNLGQTAVQPGDIRFKDLNGDGDINADDRTVIGNPFPDFTYGLNLSANYKNWDASMFINGVAGNDIYNTNIYDLQGMPRLFNSGVEILNRWTGPGTSNTIPRALGATQNVSASDRFVEDGSYTRLKNISIGYTFDSEAFKSMFSKLRLYVSGQNLITITDYSGLDPEIGNPLNSSSFEIGVDRGNYPQPKSFLIGIQASF